MKIKIWGVRGSIPTPGETTLKYGGNTPCVQIEPFSQGDAKTQTPFIVLDAGTGIRLLGNQIINTYPSDQQLDCDIFLTHVHWDHIQGIPFFKPLYRNKTNIRVFSPNHDSLASFLQNEIYPNHFPVSIDNVPSSIKFYPIEKHPYTDKSHSLKITYHAVNHGKAGSVVGYRVDSADGSFVYIPDIEPYDYPNGLSKHGFTVLTIEEQNLVKFLQGTDLMLFDTMFTNEEYERFKGWGHSPVSYALHIAAEAGVRSLGLFHYDPMRDDSDLDRLESKFYEEGCKVGVHVFASREGMVLDVEHNGKISP